MAAPYTNIKFSDAAMPRIAQATGYSNPNYNKAGFQQFLAQNPDAKAKYDQFQQQAVGTMMAARGGAVKFVGGGMVSKKFDNGGQVKKVKHFDSGGAGDGGGGDDEPDQVFVRPTTTPATTRTTPTTTPTTTPEDTTTNADRLATLGKFDPNKLTKEEIAERQTLLDTTPFNFNDTEFTPEQAKTAYDNISRKQEEFITDNDRQFLTAYSSFSGQNNPFPVIPPADPVDPTAINLEEIEKSRLKGEVADTAKVTAEKIDPATDQDITAGTGEVSGQVAAQPSGTGVSSTVDQVTGTDAATITAAQSAAGIKGVTDTTTAEQSQFDATIQAQEQNESSVSKVEAAQGEANFIDGPANREIQDGELIDSVANAEKASKYTEQIQAATASPSQKATVQGQLEKLYSDFDAAEPPPWASGAIRAANAAMAARGLSASSLAGQAVVQASMEAAIPIAQADASIFATFEQTNLSNRQQRAMLAAQQRAAFIGQEFDQAFQARVANAARISDVANLNFNAEQQVILENSRIANTFDLQNLSNKQALVMAEAASLSQLDISNLNNRQQAAVQNSQNFLQVDMANLSSRQQTTMFNAQSRVQSIFSDAAATNAARQFNATSQNQTDQFFANLGTQVNQFNSAQSNAMDQFNIGQTNAINQFNTNIANQRDQFNAQNQLVIGQSNAQWRRQIATADTAAINRQNEFNATAALGVSNQAYANIQQFTRDLVFKAIESSENALDRETRIATAIFNANNAITLKDIEADAKLDSSISTAIGTGIGAVVNLAGTSSGSSLLKSGVAAVGKIFGF